MLICAELTSISSVKFKQEELVHMALLEERRGIKKKGGLDAAVSGAEKIRTWVTIKDLNVLSWNTL